MSPANPDIPTTLVWFRDDLRVTDNPALFHAREQGNVIGVFLVTESQWDTHHVGVRRRSLVSDALSTLGHSLERLNMPLLIEDAPRFDDAPRVLLSLARRVDAQYLSFNEQFPLNERERDSRVTRAFQHSGIPVHLHQAGTIMPVGSVLTRKDTPFTVFSAFKRRWLECVDGAAIAPLPTPEPQPRLTLPGELSSAPSQATSVGEPHAMQRLETFIEANIDGYHTRRDLPAVRGTSRLSADLSIGSISARQCVYAASERDRQHRARDRRRLAGINPGVDAWISELIWRDFYRHIIALLPRISRGEAFRRDTDNLAWRTSEAELSAWQAGATGYPLVDAAMRQLNATGWMHNRLRMVSAMFLSKHLLLDWRLGERYFMEQLTDGDFAANNGGWQWSASTGTDAAPYFRIFNPTTQGERFDPQAQFVKRYVPELAGLSPKQIYRDPSAHAPSYPAPMVEHAAARSRALTAFKRLKQ